MPHTASLPARPNALLLPALLACYLVWGSTYLAIHLRCPVFRRSSRWARAF